MTLPPAGAGGSPRSFQSVKARSGLRGVLFGDMEVNTLPPRQNHPKLPGAASGGECGGDGSQTQNYSAVNYDAAAALPLSTCWSL